MTPSTLSPTAAAAEKTMQTHHRLMDHYGAPSLKERRDPLSELIVTILSQNTADVNTERAYAALKQRFPTWEDALAAPVGALAEAIHVAGLANIKAPRIHRILVDLKEERGRLDLGFLADQPVAEARRYLTALHGVGPKTAACVLLFSLHKPALPVDTHVHRVARRVGLVPARASAEQTQDLLEAMLPPNLYYPFHLNMIRHGRTLCLASRPRCSSCPLLPICDYASTIDVASQDAP